ncbi:hypothetical protein AB0C84_45380, partial [Actinomadura sp. NPDC048955]
DWPLPRTLAAVAMREHGPDARHPALPPDVLPATSPHSFCQSIRSLHTGYLLEWIAKLGPLGRIQGS